MDFTEFQRSERILSFNKLPDELIVEILSQLPPKPFFRCKSVCKTWFSLFSDAARRNKHLQPTVSGFFYNQGLFSAGFVNLSCGINKVEVDSMITSALLCHDRFSILDCCNGILLVKAYNEKYSSFTHDINVYNPATRALFTLWSHQLHDQAFSLVFDPQLFHQFHIIRFADEFDVNFLDIFSYDQRGKCKHHKKLVCDVKINHCSNSTFVDGRVHRLTTQNEILSIDMNNCSYQVIRLPNLKNRYVIEIGQSQGVLNCMSICHKKMLFIWVLESYTRQNWTLKYQMNLDAMYPGPMLDFFLYCTNRIGRSGHFAFHPEKDALFMPAEKKDSVSLDLSTGNAGLITISRDNNIEERCCWIYTPCYFI